MLRGITQAASLAGTAAVAAAVVCWLQQITKHGACIDQSKPHL
jgi:hypothetical protein